MGKPFSPYKGSKGREEGKEREGGGMGREGMGEGGVSCFLTSQEENRERRKKKNRKVFTNGILGNNCEEGLPFFLLFYRFFPSSHL
jgi:hypothetical protein